MEKEQSPRLIDHFSDLKDPRIERNKLHKLIDILTIAICAVICNADTWEDIEEFAKSKERWFRKFLELPNGIPSHDTLRRVFIRLKPEEFQAGFLSWVRALRPLLKEKQAEVVSIDGKSARRSFDTHEGLPAMHMVSAWANHSSMVLAQLRLLTEIDIESLAPVGSALRMIDELVERLDTSAIETKYDLASPQGQNPIHPKTLLKVALYALHNCRFSLRKMEEDTQYHLGYKWLTADRAIDHSTMGYFLARFHQEIVELFSQVVRICREKGLVEFDLLAVDSVKMRANASYKQTKDQEGLEKEEEKLTRRIGELLRV